MTCAVLNSDATIGSECVINTGLSMDHDCMMGDFRFNCLCG